MKQIELTEDVIVSDPCYELGTWCQERVKVKAGMYMVDAKFFDGRVDKLIVTHIDHAVVKFEKKVHCIIGVDSGQAGIFSLDTFRNGEHWYAHICDRTLNGEQWGVYGNGVVSSSGWGDGGYPVFVAKNKSGEIVGIMIDYCVSK